MTATGAVGTVQTLWRFPVKSMQGEQVDSAEVTQGGIVGDRVFAIVDGRTGKVASAKHPKIWPDLLFCRASFTREPKTGEDLPPVRIDLADGNSVTTDDPEVEAVLSGFFGRDVKLSSAASSGYTIDQYHPDEPEYDPEGHCDEVVEVSLGAAFYRERELPSAVSEGSFFDLFPLSLLTTSTLLRLRELQPGSSWDARRFRMNVIVDTPVDGFVENDWVERAVQVGDDVRLVVAMPDPRCVMPSLAQPELPRDPGILRGLATHNRLDVAGLRFPCAGVYAVAQATGTIRRGDPLRLG